MKLSYYTGGIAATNGWIWETEAGTIVVDAPHGMEEWLVQHKIEPAALLITHQHFDHIQSAQQIQERWGCPVYSWQPYSRALTLEELLERTGNPLYLVPPFTVDHVLEGQALLRIGELALQLFHIPGHSTDSVCFYSEQEGLLFGGDVLFASGLGRVDFPGGSMALLLQGIRQHLSPLPALTRVLPGHGEEAQLGYELSTNPYLH
jgi:hydroxyacylglutathione hydrolase